jgi:two-component system response regulator NreC
MDVASTFPLTYRMTNVQVSPESGRPEAESTHRSRILIADDHEVVRKGLRSILALQEDLEICGEAADGQEAILRALQLNPDLIILDVTMPVVDGFSAAKQIRKILPDVPILMLSMHNDPTMISESQLATAQGFVTKTEATATLLIAVDAVLHGKTFFSPANG